MISFVLGAFEASIWTAIALFVLVWIYAWAKGQLGSAKLAIIFAAIIVYLTFYQHPELVWILVILFLFAVFGKDFFDKFYIFREKV